MDLVKRARTTHLKQLARELGADLAGVAAIGPSPGFERYQAALDKGYDGEMTYLRRPDAVAKRADPRLLLPGARSILVVAFGYGSAEPDPPCPPGAGRVARYARGADYHKLLGPPLETLAEACRALGGEARAACDSAPVCEVAWAAAAGLGWRGKHSLLIHPSHGSWLLLGEVLTTLELEPDEPLPDRCGSCTRCLQVCPTAAFPSAYVLDARRCLAYLTIELRGDRPEPPSAGDVWLFGCDLCQEVCPWNQRFARPARLPALAGEPVLANLALAPLLELDEDGFRARFGSTPLSRAKRRGLLRNACELLGSQGSPDALSALSLALDDPEPLVRRAAARALARLKQADSWPMDP